MPGLTVDGCDVMAVYEAVMETAKAIRAGKGPALLELKTCRWRGHFEGDPQSYRTKEEMEEARRRDRSRGSRNSSWTRDGKEPELEALRGEVKREVQEAIEFTDKSDYPPQEEIFTDLVYAEGRAAR